MGRRTSGAIVGLEKIGNVQANGGVLTTTQNNLDITLDPNGTGGVIINGDVTITDQGDLRLRESSGNGTNFIAMQAASTMAANYTITWPAAVPGTAGFVLSSDTSGNLSWISLGGSITINDPGPSSTVHYPFFGTNGGSLPTSLTTINARTNLAFVPSTGTLTATAYVGGTLDGATGASGTLTLRGTSNASKAAASILMTDNVASSSTTTGTLVVTGGVGISGAVYAASGVINGTLNSLRVDNVKTGSHTLELVDRDRVVAFTGGSAQTVTIPLNAAVAFPVGTVIYIGRYGAGTLALAASGGVTVNKTGTFGTGEEITIRQRDTNNWIVIDSPTRLTATGGAISTNSGFTIHTFTSGTDSLVVS